MENSPAVSESPLKNTRRARPSGQVSFTCPSPGSAAFAASCPAGAEAVYSGGCASFPAVGAWSPRFRDSKTTRAAERSSTARRATVRGVLPGNSVVFLPATSPAQSTQAQHIAQGPIEGHPDRLGNGQGHGPTATDMILRCLTNSRRVSCSARVTSLGAVPAPSVAPDAASPHAQSASRTTGRGLPIVQCTV